MSEHTPGPWKWHWRFEDGKATGSVFAMPREGHAYAVAMCPQYQKKEQWRADARLISAAPELLEALKLAEEDLCIHTKRQWPEWDGVATPESDLGKIRAAIAKAEGRDEP